MQNGHRMIECLCDCGNTAIIRKTRLTERSKIACGCQKGKWTRHCESNSKLYRVWDSMVMRCHNSNHRAYSRYGARGITVCNEWRDYVNFRNWAVSNGYTEGLTIERINNDLGYNPSNCCWATRKQQQNNRTACHYVFYRGQIKTITEWSESLGISTTSVYKLFKDNNEAKRVEYPASHSARLQSRISKAAPQ